MFAGRMKVWANVFDVDASWNRGKIGSWMFVFRRG